MARRRRRRRARRGPKFRRRRRKRGARPFRSIGLPKTFATSLPYGATILINPGASGATGTYTFRANSLFDPDVTSAGHQPRYFDSFAPQYLRYRVVGSEIRIHCTNADTLNPQIAGIELSSNSTAQTNALALLEDPQVRTVQLSQSTAGGNTKTTRKGFSLRKAAGRLAMGDEDYSALFTANPSQEWFFHIFAFPVDNSKDALFVQFTVQIMYRVVFSDAVLPPESTA